MRVATLTPPALNFWAAKSLGLEAAIDDPAEGHISVTDPETGERLAFQPSVDWSQALPILAEEWFEIENVLIDWFGDNWSYAKAIRDNALPWFIRAFVALKFGDEVENLEFHQFQN